MPAELRLIATPEDFPADEQWEEMIRELQQLLSSDPEISVKPPPSEAVPLDAKGEPITIGVFILILSAPAVVRAVKTLNTWIKGLGNRHAKIEVSSGDKMFVVDAKGYSTKDLEKIVKAAKEQE